MIRIYLINKNELDKAELRPGIFSEERIRKTERLKREEDKKLSECAELLLIYALYKQDKLKDLPLKIRENEYKKPELSDGSIFFNISHAKDYAVCAVSDSPVGVDIEYFRVKELLNPEKMLHPEEAGLLSFISNPDEKKKYFYECWVAKESYLKNLGIGLIVRPCDFFVSEDRLIIGNREYKAPKGHHLAAVMSSGRASESHGNTLAENLRYLEKRYVHVFEPGEIRGTDWKFDAGYRMAVCSMEKDKDTMARLIGINDIKEAIDGTIKQ